MPPDDPTRIRHIIEAAETALRFVVGRTRVDIDRDDKLRFVLAQAILIVG